MRIRRDIVNVRIVGRLLTDVRELLRDIYPARFRQAKVNCAYGYLLFHRETGRFSYHHPSPSNAVLDSPITVVRREDFNNFVDGIDVFEGFSWGDRHRPNTKFYCHTVLHIQFYFYEMERPLLGCPNLSILLELKRSKSIRTMLFDAHKNRYNDNLCLIRCLAYSIYPREFEAKTFEMADRFAREYGVNIDSGVSFDDLDKLERCFDVRILLYEKPTSGEASMIRNSEGEGLIVHIHVEQGKHACLITNINRYTITYQCRECKAFFSEAGTLARHLRKRCGLGTRHTHKSGTYRPKRTVFELLELEGVYIAEHKRYYPWVVTFDFEAVLSKSDLHPTSQCVDYLNRHVPASVSVATNMPGYDDVKTFISRGDPYELIKEMLNYLEMLQRDALYMMEGLFDQELAVIRERIQEQKALESGSVPLENVIKQFRQWYSRLVCVGFNSGRYDLVLTKRYLLKYLREDDEFFVLKRGNGYINICSSKLSFLDISQYLAPGFNLHGYLKLYGDGTAAKFYFPCGVY